MSKKPLADDRRRGHATEAFAKVVRAAFKGETDKAKEAVAIIENQFADEVDILERARRFAAINSPHSQKLGKPKNSAERLLAGVISLNRGELDEAEKVLGEVLAENAKSADAHYVLAVIRARRERTDDAIASLKSACALSAERRAQARLDAEFSALHGNPGFDSITTG